MNQKLAKKIRKNLKRSSEETAKAFRDMVKKQSFGRRVLLAWRILINRV